MTPEEVCEKIINMLERTVASNAEVLGLGERAASLTRQTNANTAKVNEFATMIKANRERSKELFRFPTDEIKTALIERQAVIAEITAVTESAFIVPEHTSRVLFLYGQLQVQAYRIDQLLKEDAS